MTIKVNAVRRETLPEKIIGEIKVLIDSGQLTPGSKLPSERDFAAMLGVGRPSLREALKALSVLGLVEHHHGEGNFLTDSPDQWPLEPLSIFFSMKKGALLEIYEARKGLEVQAAHLAARRRSASDLARIAACLDKMGRSVGDLATFLKQDMAYHMAIATASRNQLILDLVTKMHKLSYETRTSLWTAIDHGEVDSRYDLEEHGKLFHLIEAEDPDGAARCISLHMDYIIARVQRCLILGDNPVATNS